MKIKLGALRRLVREALLEAGGGTTLPPQPVTRNPMSPSLTDREQITKMSISNLEDEDALAPHLQDPQYEEEDCWGPVPPTAENPYALPDFYTNDFSVLPTPPIKR
jgi:hypothetical protein